MRGFWCISRYMRRGFPVLGLAVAWACTGSDDDGGASGPTAASTSAVTEGMSSTSVAASSTATTGLSASETANTDTCASSECTSGPGPGEPCDIWAQDCPAGYKCDPHSFDTSSFPFDARCNPLDPYPKNLGEDCEITYPWAGDNCAEGLMCDWQWYMSHEECEGTCGVCRHYCKGADGDASCPKSADHCFVIQTGHYGVCLEACDPLMHDCLPLDICQAHLEFLSSDLVYFFCERDRGDPDMPPSEGGQCFNQECGHGRFCWQNTCRSLCDLRAPNTCELKDEGAVCMSFISQGLTPTAGLEHVGFCAVP